MIMEFRIAYRAGRNPGQVMDSVSKVETVGYVSAKERIERMMEAGSRLNMFRREQFDFEMDKVEENWEDVTRKPGFDMADAAQSLLAVEKRIESAKKVAAEKKKEEEKKKEVDNGTTG